MTLTMTLLRRNATLAIILSAMLLAAFASMVAANEATEPVWIDVRSWVEYQTDSIEGDPRFHYTEIVESVREAYPNTDTAIKLYCAKGGRAAKALAALQEAGYSNLENAGGIDDVRIARGLLQTD